MFKIGQRVICIYDINQDMESMRVAIEYNLKFPILDKIYTIRDFVSYDTPGILLHEIRNELIDGRNEIGFKYKIFREIDERFAEETMKKVQREIKTQVQIEQLLEAIEKL